MCSGMCADMTSRVTKHAEYARLVFVTAKLLFLTWFWHANPRLLICQLQRLQKYALQHWFRNVGALYQKAHKRFPIKLYGMSLTVLERTQRRGHKIANLRMLIYTRTLRPWNLQTRGYHTIGLSSFTFIQRQRPPENALFL